MSVLESSNLRDLLRVRDNEDDGREALAGLTLAAVLGCESNIRRPSRTLLDIIKDEESGAAYRGLIPPTDHHHHHNRNNNSWKSFKNRLRLRRAGEAFSSATSSNPVNACDFSIEDCNIRISTPVLMERRGVSINQRLNRNSSLVSPPNGASPVVTPRRGGDEEQRPAREEMGLHSMETALEVNLVENSVEQRPEREMGVSVTEDHAPAGEIVLNSGVNTVENDRNATAEEAEEVVAPPRVSLMALLEETDWSIGGNVGSTVMDIDEVEEELGGEGKKDGVVMGGGKEGGGGGGEYVCCVCMVRHKGAAFIPCGHTFCRLCSRELWVNRGNCPLCNGFILEILDIF